MEVANEEQMLDRSILPLFPRGGPAPRLGASYGADCGRYRTRASGLCGLRTGVSGAGILQPIPPVCSIIS